MAEECSPGRKPGDLRRYQDRALEEGDRNLCRPYGALQFFGVAFPRAYARGYYSAARWRGLLEPFTFTRKLGSSSGLLRFTVGYRLVLAEQISSKP